MEKKSIVLSLSAETQKMRRHYYLYLVKAGSGKTLTIIDTETMPTLYADINLLSMFNRKN